MKKLIIQLFVIGISLTLLISCDDMFGDFLEKAPGVDVTEDTIFSSVTQAESFLASVYESGMYTAHPGQMKEGNPHNGHICNNSHWANATDESDQATTWYQVQSVWNAGGLTAITADQEDQWWFARWKTFRRAYTMIERIDDVPEIDPAYAARIKGEMKFIIAMNYFEMFKRYGGVPIITKRFDPNDDMKIKRSTLDSTLQFILTNCNEAAAILPDAWPSQWKGRVTKGAVLALKAKTLLYAASPIANTATPYLSMTNPADNKYIVFGDYKVSRWQDAANAAKAVLDWAPSGGIQLITDKGVDKNYKYVWEVNDNAEIILAQKSSTGGRSKLSDANFPWPAYLPASFGGWGSNCTTQGFIEKFYDKTDGTPQVWGATGSNLNKIYAELDPRFKQTVGYNGTLWNSIRGTLETFLPNGKHKASCTTGYHFKKFIPDKQNSTSFVESYPSWPVFRLAEFYLMYAEAINEASGGPTPDAYTAINTIRSRSGMPNLPSGLTQEEFRQRVRKEWAVEFAFEDHRFWDVRRWLTAEENGVMNGPIYGLKIYKMAGTNPQDFSYERYVVENRVFLTKLYRNPFPLREVNKGYLIQNPGY